MESLLYLSWLLILLYGVWVGFMQGDRDRGLGPCVVGLFGLALTDLALYRFVNPFTTGLALLNFWLWWNNRGGKRRRKQLRDLGEKGKARIKALVDQMTPSPIPQPQGALAIAEIKRARVCAECGMLTDDYARSTGHATICSCLEPGGLSQRVWAVDPGDKHVGVAVGLVDQDEARTLDSFTFTPDDWIEYLIGVLNRNEVDLVVCEEFRLYPWLVREQGFSDFPTVELIGVIKYLCGKSQTPVVMHGAHIKKNSVKVAKTKGVPLAKLRSGREDFPGRNQHERDSKAHFYWWAFRNERSPIVLAEKMHSRAGQSRKRP